MLTNGASGVVSRSRVGDRVCVPSDSLGVYCASAERPPLGPTGDIRDPPPCVAGGHLFGGGRFLFPAHLTTVRRVSIVLVALAIAAAVIMLNEAITASDVEDMLIARGWLGPLVFVAAMWVLQPLLLPGPVFMIPASLVWSAPVAMALSWVGNMGASFVAFGFARWMARDWAQGRLTERLRVWDDRLEGGGVREVALFRLFTGQITPADWLLGVSSVRLTPFVVGTAIGIIPSIVIVVLAGASVGDWLFAEPYRWGGVLVALGAVSALSRGRGRRRAAAAARS